MLESTSIEFVAQEEIANNLHVHSLNWYHQLRVLFNESGQLLVFSCSHPPNSLEFKLSQAWKHFAHLDRYTSCFYYWNDCFIVIDDVVVAMNFNSQNVILQGTQPIIKHSHYWFIVKRNLIMLFTSSFLANSASDCS